MIVSSISRSVEVRAEPERVLAVVLDVTAYPEWQQDVHRVDIVTSDGRGRPMRTTVSIRSMGFRGRYTVDYAYPSESLVEYHLVESDMMSRNDACFDAVPHGNGITRLTVTMDLALVWPLPRPVLDRLVRRGVDAALAAIKERAERA